MRRILFCLFCALFFNTLFAYDKPAHIPQKTWDDAARYFLPEDHPAKAVLDDIFGKRRAVLNLKTMKAAGFAVNDPQKFTRMVLARHPRLQGYLIKTYLDSQKAHKNKPEEYYWIKRIEGANATRAYIEQNGWQATFAVPQKWIYPLPAEPSPPDAFDRIDFILLVEDMNILDDEANRKKWKSDAITKDMLKELTKILEAVGLSDCAKPDNAPFTKDGRIAFIDTQTHHSWPVTYKKMDPSLSATMKPYWKKLTKDKRKS